MAGEVGGRVKRKLAAILAADIAGYSALMGSDEVGTVQALKGHQDVILPLIDAHSGRLIDTAGDGILADFTSAVGAVECALEIQRVMADRNAGVPSDRQMWFRIGINLGDVIFDEVKVYGDGVNVAARLESLAEPGGICVSEKVRAEIAGKIDVTLTDLGKQLLKNISQPVAVYKIGLRIDVARYLPAKVTLAAPNKASIAVLPFTNMSGDQSQEYFSDGITEDIITELSRFSELFVIARNSSFQYKGKSPDIRQVGTELGVSYVLEGSIRRAASRIRITAQLIETATGSHRWAERYDRTLEDIFAVQDEVACSIVGLLTAHVRRAEQQRALAIGSGTFRAYDYYLQAASRYAESVSYTQLEPLLEARKLLDACLRADCRFARAYILFSETKTRAYSLRISPNNNEFFRKDALAESYNAAIKAIALAPDSSEAHAQLSYVYSWMEKHDLAIKEIETAISLNPNFSDWRVVAGLLYAGHYDRCILEARRNMRLDPFAPSLVQGLMGFALMLMKNYEEAIHELQHFLERSHGHLGGRYWLISCYFHVGRTEDAKREVENLLSLWPDFGISKSAAIRFPLKDKVAKEIFLRGLRNAGLPD